MNASEYSVKGGENRSTNKHQNIAMSVASSVDQRSTEFKHSSLLKKSPIDKCTRVLQASVLMLAR